MNILDRLPVLEKDAEISGPDGQPLLGPDGSPLAVKRYQIAAWASISAKDALIWESRASPFSNDPRHGVESQLRHHT